MFAPTSMIKFEKDFLDSIILQQIDPILYQLLSLKAISNNKYHESCKRLTLL